jgi:hypothetical protein
MPLTFAIAGLVIGFAFMAAYFYALHYNPFHFPTQEQVQHLQSYSPPSLYTFLERLMFALVPALLFPAIGVDGWAAIVLWVMAVLLNAPIYYCAGLAFAWALKRTGFAKRA